MRPPILQWKVMLALIVVVIAGASLGSALDSPQTAKRLADYRPGVTVHTYVLGQSVGPINITPASIHDTNRKVTPQMAGRMRHQACAMFKRQLLKHQLPESELPQFCRVAPPTAARSHG